MFKRLGLKTLALGAVLAAAVPGVSFARDHDDHRGGRDEHHEVYRGGRDRDRGRWNFGVGIYAAPAPVPVPVPAPPASGYYDQYGVWHPYTTYPYGAPSPYGY